MMGNNSLRSNREYYDSFSEVYEDRRHKGYHLWLDDLETEILRPYAEGRKVLEAGCGTGLLLQRVSRFAAIAVGADLSEGMLQKARDRGLDVHQADIIDLPFEDRSFDTVYSFKVLAHVEDIREALAELSRVTRPGGHLLLEFYNPDSLRGLIKRLKPATEISGNTDDHQVFTRYDKASRILSYLPEDLQWQAWRGVRILTPFAMAHRVPAIGRLLQKAENGLSNTIAARFAGFLVAIVRKKD